MRTGPPEPAACGVRLPTASFGDVYAANAELAKTSVENAAQTSSAARIDFLMQCPFLLRSGVVRTSMEPGGSCQAISPLVLGGKRRECSDSVRSARGDKRPDGHPVHLVVAHQLGLRDRVVVARARGDPD